MTFNAEIRWAPPPGVWLGEGARIRITQCSALMGNITLQSQVVNGIFHTLNYSLKNRRQSSVLLFFLEVFGTFAGGFQAVFHCGVGRIERFAQGLILCAQGFNFAVRGADQGGYKVVDADIQRRREFMDRFQFRAVGAVLQ